VLLKVTFDKGAKFSAQDSEIMSEYSALESQKAPKHTNRRFPRFLVVGTTCFAVNLGILQLGTGILGAHYFVSLAASTIITNGLGFALNRRWTFEAQQGHFWFQLASYYGVNCGTFALNFILMGLLVSGLKINYLLASAFLGIAFTLVNFFLHGRWSFRALH
jgi:putative flippase GtrA